MKCKYCGKDLAFGAKFCTGCGKAVEPEETAEGAAEITENVPSLLADDPEKTELITVDDAVDSASGIIGESVAEAAETAEAKAEEIAEDIPAPAPSLLSDDTEKTELIPAEELVDDIAESVPAPAAPAFEQPAPAPVQQPMFQTPPPQQNAAFVPPPAAPMPVPAPAPEPKKSSKVGAGRLTGAAILGFFTIIFVVALSLLTAVKFGLTGEKVGDRAKQLDSATLLSTEYDGDELAVSLYKSLGFGSVTGGKATEVNFKSFLMKTDLLDFLGENASNYADYIIAGKGSDPSVTTDDIVDFFESNESVIKSELDHKMTKSDYKKLRSNLNADEDDTLETKLSITEIGNNVGFDLSKANLLFSYITLGVLLALVLLFLIWIVFVVDRKGRYVLGSYGSILTISGIVVLFAGLAAFAGMAVAYVLTSEVAYYILSNVLLPFAMIAGCIGLGELVIGIIFRAISRGLKRKAKYAERA